MLTGWPRSGQPLPHPCAGTAGRTVLTMPLPCLSLLCFLVSKSEVWGLHCRAHYRRSNQLENSTAPHIPPANARTPGLEGVKKLPSTVDVSGTPTLSLRWCSTCPRVLMPKKPQRSGPRVSPPVSIQSGSHKFPCNSHGNQTATLTGRCYQSHAESLVTATVRIGPQTWISVAVFDIGFLADLHI